MNKRRLRGYTLIEVLASLSLLVMLIPTGSRFYVSITRLHMAQSAALDHVLLFDDLEHDFRAAAAGALEITASAGTFKSGDGTVVLRTGVGFTVFAVDKNRHPQRITFVRAKGGWVQRINTYRTPQWSVAFSASPGGRGATFTAKPVQPLNRQGLKNPEVHVLAALRSFDAEGGTP